MHIKAITYLGADTREIARYFPRKRESSGTGRKASREEIARGNERKRVRYMQRLIALNFKAGDWHLILKYGVKKRPKTYEEAQGDLRDFIAMMRQYFKGAGRAFKYIAVTERGKKGALHHHLIIEDDREVGTVTAVKTLWKGHTFFSEMYDFKEFHDLAEYICKKESKEELGEHKARYKASRNLIRPKTIRVPIFKRAWPEEPVAPQGWYVEKDSIVNTTIKETGLPYQRYILRRIDKNGEKEEGALQKAAGRIRGRIEGAVDVLKDTWAFFKERRRRQ